MFCDSEGTRWSCSKRSRIPGATVHRWKCVVIWWSFNTSIWLSDWVRLPSPFSIWTNSFRKCSFMDSNEDFSAVFCTTVVVSHCCFLHSWDFCLINLKETAVAGLEQASQKLNQVPSITLWNTSILFHLII